MMQAVKFEVTVDTLAVGVTHDEWQARLRRSLKNAQRADQALRAQSAEGRRDALVYLATVLDQLADLSNEIEDFDSKPKEKR